jgi:hypothetical protein
MMTRLSAVPNRSETVRPVSIADRAIGRDRNRSTMPSVMSRDTLTAVLPAVKNTLCTKMPGIRYSR